MDVSSLLQRERTALKIMLQLLVEQKDTTQAGRHRPSGRSVRRRRGRATKRSSDVMRVHFENAKKLYQQKLRPILERDHGLTFEQAALLPAGRSAGRRASERRPAGEDTATLGLGSECRIAAGTDC